MEMSLLWILWMSALFFQNSAFARRGRTHEHLDFIGLVESNGYKGESYRVETLDGYILRIDRISESPVSPASRNKSVVFLQHGFLGSSEFFVCRQPRDSLAYLLADAGYDVWISNLRGNTNGRAHRTLSPDDHKFWNFTLDDHATKDLPALIDFALEQTGRSNLTYIGHSMGTTLSYILLSEKPEYNEKINLAVSLAPIAYWGFSTMGLLSVMLDYVVDTLSEDLKAPDYAAEMLPHDTFMKEFVGNYCDDESSILCVFLINSFFRHAGGSSQAVISKEMRPLTEYAPAGTSLKILQHYRQMINSGEFRKFDYESVGRNMQIYSKKQPPRYDLWKITCKNALIWVHNDPLSHEMNVQLLAKYLPRVVAFEPVPSVLFRHADFLFYRSGGIIIHNRILQLINQHHNSTIGGDRSFGIKRSNKKMRIVSI